MMEASASWVSETGSEPGVVSGSFAGWEEPSEPLGPHLLRSLRRLGDSVIQVYPHEKREWRASALAARAEAFAHALKDMGVGKGDHVVFVSKRHPENAPLMLATLLSGAAWAPVVDRLEPEAVRRLLDIIQPKVVFTETSAAETLKGITSGAALVLLGEGEAWARFERRAAEAEAEAERGRTPFVPPPLGDLRSARAFLLCSSGTTGPPKVVVHTQYGVHACLVMLRKEDSICKKGDIVVFNSAACWVSAVLYMLSSIDFGFTLVHVNGYAPNDCLEFIEKYKASVFFAANNFLVQTGKQHEVNPAHDLSSIREMLCGGAAMGKDVQEYLHGVFGCRVHQVYGMTELNSGTGFTISATVKFGSVGICAPFMKCRIVNPVTGKIVGRNERGELRFKGPTITPGYLHNEEASRAAFDEEGWLRSGDIGYADEDGFFYITGRIKDIIKYRGMHITPVDIEDFLYSHDEVVECAVVGVPHPTEQELPRAYLVLRKGASTTTEELCKFVEGNLPEYKWLRGGVVFLDSLPKTATGKINRRWIRENYVLKDDADEAIKML